MNVLDMMNSSSRHAGIIQQNEVLSGENFTFVLKALSSFVDFCSNNSLLVYYRSNSEFTLVGGQGVYTLGTGGDWDIPRPMKIEKLQMRLNPGSLQQLDITASPLTWRQYADVSVKETSSTWAFAYYDDNNYPLRNVYLFPIPTGPVNVMLWLREPLINMSQNSVVAYGTIQSGSGYPNGTYPNQKLGGGTGSGAIADIQVVNGAVVDVVLKDGGSGYAINDVLYISPIQIGNNIINGVSITTAGTGYINGTYLNVPLISTFGVGAQATITVTGGVVSNFVITNSGNGYTAGSIVKILGTPSWAGTGFTGTINSVSSATSGSGFALPVTFVSANITAPIEYPPGYDYFFEWNLTKRILAQFGKGVRQDVEAFALEGKQALETLNMVPIYSRGDGGMSRSGRNRFFNFITGNFWSFGNN